MTPTNKKIKRLITLAPSVEEADKIISDNYGFKTVKEKIAFLKGMFEISVIDVHDHEDVTQEESDEMTYFTILQAITQ